MLLQQCVGWSTVCIGKDGKQLQYRFMTIRIIIAVHMHVSLYIHTVHKQLCIILYIHKHMNIHEL